MPAIRGINSKSKTRRRVRDLDQVHSDLRDAKHLSQYKDTKAVDDLPGLGEHYCIECAKWFEGEHNLVAHRRGKPHKRRCGQTWHFARTVKLMNGRVRQLRDDPYTQKSAEAAVGLTTDNGKSQTMAVDTEEEMPDAGAALVHAEPAEVEADAEVHDAFFSAYEVNGSIKT